MGVDGDAIETADTTRVVTLSGDLAEFVFEFGLGASVVATDVTTVESEEAVALPKAGIGRFHMTFGRTSKMGPKTTSMITRTCRGTLLIAQSTKPSDG